MYQVETNYGSYTLALMPSSEDILKYYHTARQAGLEIEAIKFRVRELERPAFDSISTIIRNIK